MTKLLQLYTLEEEQMRTDGGITEWQPTVRFEQIRITLPGGDFVLNYEFGAGRAAMIETRSTNQITSIVNLLLNFARPKTGRILLGGHDVDDFNVHRLRDEVLVIDNAVIPECSIAEYLAIADPDLSRARMRAALETVGLHSDLPWVSDNLDVNLTPDGYPLSVAGVIKLKIAFAIVAKPQVIVLTPLFDMLSHEARNSVMRYLRESTTTTVLCFSHRRDLHLYDDYVLFDFDQQTHFASIDGLAEAHGLVVSRHEAAINAERVSGP